ncbi:hypothetical protein [Kangiella sp. M94]
MRYLIFMFILTLQVLSYATELQCPNNGHLKIKEVKEQNIRAEWCENNDGIKDGPLRYVRIDNNLIEVEVPYRLGKKHGISYSYLDNSLPEAEITYENGIEIDFKFTIHGLKNIEKNINDSAKANGKPWKIVFL